jgi:hypothetical protein
MANNLLLIQENKSYLIIDNCDDPKEQFENYFNKSMLFRWTVTKNWYIVKEFS